MPFYGQYAGFGGGGDPNRTLIDIITGLGLTTGLRLCLDAGDANSYTSGQQWLDTSGGGYDMDFGSSASSASDDPTFNGTAGGLSSAEYMSFDGGDHFEYETTIATWMNNLHKNNAKFSWFVVHYPTGGSGGVTFATSAANVVPGMMLLSDDGRGLPGPGPYIYIHNVGTHELLAGGTGPVTSNQWHMQGGTVDEAGGDVSHWWLNGAVDAVRTSSEGQTGDTYSAVITNPSTASADNFRLGARGDGQHLPSGTRMAAFAFWEGSGLLTTANFNSIRNKLLGRGF